MRLLALGILILFAAQAQGQDPLKVDPRHYRVEFENSSVRIVRVHFGPHYKSVVNETPPRVVVVLTDEHIKITHPDGKSERRDLKAGTAFWSEGGKGIPENLSEHSFDLIWVVLQTRPTHNSLSSTETPFVAVYGSSRRHAHRPNARFRGEFQTYR